MGSEMCIRDSSSSHPIYQRIRHPIPHLPDFGGSVLRAHPCTLKSTCGAPPGGGPPRIAPRCRRAQGERGNRAVLDMRCATVRCKTKGDVLMQVTRRDLVKFGGAACLVAGATVGAGAAMADEAGYLVGSSDIAFSEETDILIIGTGVAGLAAGMEPALAGKKIIFAEKKGSFGGDSAMSCWFMFATGTKNQLEHGAQTTIEQAWEKAKEKQTATFDFDWWPQYAEGKYCLLYTSPSPRDS